MQQRSLFLKLLCVLDALLKLLESYYGIKVVQMNRGLLFFQIFLAWFYDRDGVP
jgi:hypothetical protein